MVVETGLGFYLQQLRKERKLSLREVASYLGIDTSMLSKIEHGERQLQGHFLKPLASLYELSFKEIQMKFLHEKIKIEFGEEPFLKETLESYLEKISK